MTKVEEEVLAAAKAYGDARADVEACGSGVRSIDWAAKVGAVRVAHAKLVSASRSYATTVRTKAKDKEITP